MEEVLVITAAQSATPGKDYLERLRESTPAIFHCDVVGPDPNGRYSKRPCKYPGCERVSFKEVLCWPHHRLAEQNPDLLTTTPDPIRSPPGAGTRKGLAVRGRFDLAECRSTLLRAELAYGLVHARVNDMAVL